jgi:hypothetical protein
MTHLIEYEDMLTYIIENYKDNLTEDNYYDAKHDAIDDYIVNKRYDLEEMVNKYGILKAIKQTNYEYDTIEIGEDDIKTYQTLAYTIIAEDFNNKFPDHNAINMAIWILKDDQDEDE